MIKDRQPNYTYLHELADDSVGAVPLSAESTSALLGEIRTICTGKRVVFDLDSTLLNNRPRHAAIMREFATVAKQPLLATASAEHFPNWSARNSLALLGLDAGLIESLMPRYEVFWHERFFTSEYCRYDTAVIGAADFVNAVAAAKGEVVYLTGRHEAMREGSIASLRKLGFPVPGAAPTDAASTDARATAANMTSAITDAPGVATLIMKPEFIQADDDYKQQALENLLAGVSVCAAFDNEPAHINHYRRAFPHARCVHLLTDHSMRDIQLLENIVSIQNFLFSESG